MDHMPPAIRLPIVVAGLVASKGNARASPGWVVDRNQNRDIGSDSGARLNQFVLTTVDSSISVGSFEGFSWIRPHGKGSFMNSPALKAYCDSRLAAGENLLVVDLADCGGMDSTFMGTLAGTAARLSAINGGRLHIAEPGERNRRSLEDLGLDFLMDIDPPSAPWRGSIESIRSGLQPLHQQPDSGRLQRTRHVLDAHQTLSGINRKNASGFAGVVGTLKEELSKKERLANDGGSA